MMLHKVTIRIQRLNSQCAVSVYYSSSSSLSYDRPTASSKLHYYQRFISHQFYLEVLFYYSNNTQKDCSCNCTLIFRLHLFMVIGTTLRCLLDVLLRCLFLNLGINRGLLNYVMTRLQPYFAYLWIRQFSTLQARHVTA